MNDSFPKPVSPPCLTDLTREQEVFRACALGARMAGYNVGIDPASDDPPSTETTDVLLARRRMRGLLDHESGF